MLFACEVAEPIDGPAASASDADASDSGDGSDGASSLPESTAPNDDERIVSLAGESGEARDDVFPDLAGDDLAWVRVWLDRTAGGAAEDTDCLSCPYCAGCRFDVVYRKLPDGPAEVLFSASTPQSSPRVGDGVVTWLDGSGGFGIRELAPRSTVRVPSTRWLSAAPTPFGGKLWWWSYDDNTGGYGVVAYDRKAEVTRTQLTTYMHDPSVSASDALWNLVRRQPFSISERGLLFGIWENNLEVRHWPFAGQAKALLAENERRHERAFMRPDGTLLTFNTDISAACVGGCAQKITAFDDDGEHALAPDAVPSRYVAPVLAGDRLIWVDHREGAYAVYGLHTDAREERLSSEAAVIGAVSTLAASDGRAIWSDRRSGRWRLMMRRW